MICDTIKMALMDFGGCEITPNGARVQTHCLYPSFSPVNIIIIRYGDGYIVHDGGEAAAAAWLHGRDERLSSRYLKQQADRYGLNFENGQLVAKVESADWLASAIISVANAASFAATAAVEHVVKSTIMGLQDKIYRSLVGTFAESRVGRDVERSGESGRTYHFDFAVTDSGKSILIDAVTPFAQSVFAKYTAFADTREDGVQKKFAVYERPLASEDRTLLSQVADVVPFASMTEATQRSLRYAARN